MTSMPQHDQRQGTAVAAVLVETCGEKSEPIILPSGESEEYFAPAKEFKQTILVSRTLIINKKNPKKTSFKRVFLTEEKVAILEHHW